MLNAKYFKAKFEGTEAKAEPRVRTDVHLHSGAVFEIESVEAIEEGYVVLKVYPPRDSDAAARRERGESPADGAAVDRLVVAYESINCLHFATPTPKRSGQRAGF